MYARSLIDSRIEIAERELGFKLEYHTTSEIDDFNANLESKYEAEYVAASKSGQSSTSSNAQLVSLIRALANPEDPKLSSDEIRFIKNERAICICDAEYFLTSYYWIKTQTRIIRFAFRAAQRVFYNVIQELHLAGAPIEIIMAKARQLGISTVTEGLMVHSVNFGYGVNAVVASADEKKTAKMSQMTLLGYDYMPWWLKSVATARNANALYMHGILSGISFQHGSQQSGIGRGDTVLKYHLSEVSSYTNPVEQIETALWKCVHPDPAVLGILESTAEGNTGWFYDNYWESKARRREGKPSRLTALFVPWTVATDQYPNPTWIKVNPIPRNWEPMTETRGMMDRAKDYIRTNPALEAVLGANWECGREQAWYWESHYEEAKPKGTEKLFLQEMPCDDRESFQSSYDNVFGREVIAEIDSRRESRYHVFGIVGQSIEDRYEPTEDEFDESISPISIRFHNRIKDIAYRWDLQPLLWREPFKAIEDIRSVDDHHMGKLFVFREPERGFDYSMGVRTGDGLGSSDTVIAVARRGRDPQETDVQVAEFRSNVVSHVEAYAWTMAIAAYYGKHMGMDGVAKTQPYVAIESMQTVGDHCYLQMQKMGYRRFHKMTRYDTDPRNMNARKAAGGRVGWFSTGWSTPMYTGTFVVWVRNGWYQVNSPYTIWEMDHWEQHLTVAGKSKYLSSDESTDAGVLANAMAAFCVNDMRSMAERTMKRCYDGRGAKAKLDLTPSGSGIAFPTSGMYNSYDERKLFGRQQY